MTGPLEAVAVLSGISLAEVNEIAELQTRIDRKYVVDESTATDLIVAVARAYSVLEIGGRRDFGYESIYFDTTALDLYHEAARRRRRRFKVRTRMHQGAEVAMLEVKMRSGRGETVKARRPHNTETRDILEADDRRYIEAVTGRVDAGAELEPALTTGYRRVSLIDRERRSRLTMDSDVVCNDGLVSTGIRGIVVETKSSGPATVADLWLWRRGHRPLRLSKYCTGLAALRSDLPSNKWHRTLRRHMMPPAPDWGREVATNPLTDTTARTPQTGAHADERHPRSDRPQPSPKAG